VQAALATPLDHLCGFLGYTEERAIEAFRAICHGLADVCADAQRLEAFARAALDDSLTQVVGFMRLAAQSFPEIANSLNEAFANEFRRCGVEHPRLAAARENPALLASVEPVLRGCGCANLLETIAQTAVARVLLRGGLSPDVTLSHVSALLRLARHAPEADLRKFLDVAISPEWLHKSFSHLPPHDMAIALQVLWSWTAPDICRRFRHPRLGNRAAGLARNLYRCANYARGGPILELIGACFLLGVDSLSWIPVWPSQTTVAAFIEANDAGNVKRHIDGHRALFIIGLRALARRARTIYAMPPEVGGRLLAQWRATESDNPNHRNLKSWMITWLEKCGQDSWKLLVDRTPVPTQVPVP